MNEISNLLTNESVISFADGTIVKGSKDVAGLIMRCCREYNHGYLIGRNKAMTKWIAIGMVSSGVVIGVSEIIAMKIKSKKIKEEA